MKYVVSASPELVETYGRLFVNRGAYTLQSMRPDPESGRHHYYRPKAPKTGRELALNAVTIRRHLQGEITIGLYAINPVTQRSKWVAIDADYAGAMEDLLKLQYSLQQDRVEAALEMSKRGGHLWIFMQPPALARECRVYIYNLALNLGMKIKGNGLTEGIEIFPKHDDLAPRRVWKRDPGPTWHSPWGESALLVLRSRLRSAKTNGVPGTAAKAERRRTAEVHNRKGHAS